MTGGNGSIGAILAAGALTIAGVLSGNTRPIEALLRAHGFEWLAASELWYIRKTRGLAGRAR